MPQTPLTGLRRQQLVDLARAYEIPIPPGATKKEMLPVMIAAEQRNVFKSEPKHPWYLQKAVRTTDTPYIPLPENPEIAAAPAADGAPQTQAQPVDPAAPRLTRTGRKESDYHRKQRILKERGIKTFGLPKAEMDRLAEEHGIR